MFWTGMMCTVFVSFGAGGGRKSPSDNKFVYAGYADMIVKLDDKITRKF